ncbi:ComEA family DNA-binding protein [Acholeplasma equirhinis]|uniref:helix-hairpin-helix domain-containing protein n=1 Tax=Acholeplasma equirhinis TaxID=555393 RepID=UPI00197AE487|nr:ComEA family DNA-binding protein [Acholeplasma equirhinis]MBN3490583.1 ComEA family DNA-binding protein [Acholeplasma equirhinis]
MRKNIVFVVIVLFVVAAIYFFPKVKEYPYFEGQNEMITVEIKGAVINPGKYKLSRGNNLAYLIHLAGGLTESANLDGFNLNNLVEETTYEIPTVSYANVESNYKVNLNEVTYLELLAIPNISDTKALNILLYRTSIGKFTEVEELLNVKGIGEATFEKIKSYFYL